MAAMNSLRQLTVSGLLVGSSVSSLFLIGGVDLSMLFAVRWVLYFPFFGVFYLFSLMERFSGLEVFFPIVFLVGVVFTAWYLAVLLDRAPRKIVYVGVGVVFFLFLLVVGRGAFTSFIFLPQTTRLRTALGSVKTFVEFLIVLVLLYCVLDDISLEEVGKGKPI